MHTKGLLQIDILIFKQYNESLNEHFNKKMLLFHWTNAVLMNIVDTVSDRRDLRKNGGVVFKRNIRTRQLHSLEGCVPSLRLVTKACDSTMVFIVRSDPLLDQINNPLILM